MLRTECSGIFAKKVTSPCPYYRSMRGFFSNIHHENLVGFLMVKLN